MKAYRKLDTLRQSFFSRKVQDSLKSIVALSSCNIYLNLWLLFLSWHILCPETSSWKDNEIVYCHLFTRNLASFSVRQLPDELTRPWLSFPHFPLVLLLNCPPNLCPTLNPLDQLHKMWILCNVLKTYLVYCSLNGASTAH